MAFEIYPEQNLTADGTTTVNLPGGEYAVTAAGTWGSGTLAIKWNDGTNSVTYPDGSLTADGGLIIAVGTGKIDLVLSGSSSPDLIVKFNRIS